MLSRLSYRCLVWGCSLKLLPALERIEREKEQEQKDSYLKQCCQALTDEIMELMRTITNHIAADLRAILGSGGGGGQEARSLSLKRIVSSTHLKSLKECIPYFYAIPSYAFLKYCEILGISLLCCM